MASDPDYISQAQLAEELAISDDKQRIATRKMSVQRLQIGLLGLGAMVLLVGLANIIQNSAAETQATSIVQNAPIEVIEEPAAPILDPLVNAGVVPELTTEAVPEEDDSAINLGEDMAEPLGVENMGAKNPDAGNIAE